MEINQKLIPVINSIITAMQSTQLILTLKTKHKDISLQSQAKPFINK